MKRMPTSGESDKDGSDARSIGEHNERRAERFLIDRGLHLLARNYRCRFGEIDLVLRDGGVLVFVEVRFRRASSFGTAAETVTTSKQRRLITTARHYLQSHPSVLPCRFDVVAINGQNKPQWIKHAFAVDSP